MLVTGSSVRGVEERWKRSELRREYELLRQRSWWRQASKKSSIPVKAWLPVPETDTGGVVENTEVREVTLSKELGKMAP